MSDMTNRGSGQTTKQMVAAPKDAIFVWPVSRSLSYAKELARYLSRKDLVIISQEHMEERLQASTRPIIIDHGCRLTARQADMVDYINAKKARP